MIPSKNKIKILHVVGGMNRGGVETFLINILKTSDTKKYEIIFLCYGNAKFDYDDEIISLGGCVLRLPDVKEIGIIRHISNIRNIIKSNNINIVHAHTYYNSVFSLVAARLSKVTIRIVHAHSTYSEINPNPLKKIYFLIAKIAINYLATEKIACGNTAGKALYNKSKFIIVKNGILTENFMFNKEIRQQLRSQLRINNSTTVIGHVGRFETVKNHVFLIDVFKDYLKLNGNSTLLLIGNGELEKNIELKVDELGLSSKVIFLGSVANANDFYNIMDVFIFPSYFEGLGMALIEAQVNGLKCIASTGVPNEARITNSVKFLSLDLGVSKWSKIIKNMNMKRQDISNHDHIHDYNIRNSKIKLEAIYDEK
jgi:glycosyltransferase involved in cell wall biosynthesis